MLNTVLSEDLLLLLQRLEGGEEERRKLTVELRRELQARREEERIYDEARAKLEREYRSEVKAANYRAEYYSNY